VNLLPSLLLMLIGIGQWIQVRIQSQPQDPLEKMIFLFLAILFGVTCLAEDWQVSLPGSFNHWPFLIIFLACSSAFAQRPEWMMEVAKVGMISSWGIALLGWGQYLLGWQGSWIWGILVFELLPGSRPTSLFTSPNTLAIYLVTVLSVAIGMVLQHQSRILAFLTVVLEFPLLILTASRNGWGITWVAIVLFLGISRCWRWLATWLGISFLPLGAAIGIPGLRWIVPELIWGRLAATLDPQATHFSSTANRWHAWTFAWDLFRERPWWGWGWQSFSGIYQRQDPPELLGHAHHLYLTLAAEGGILTLVGFVTLWIWILWRGWQARGQRSEASLILGIMIALVAYFCSGLLDAVFLDGRIHLWIWILLASLNGSFLSLLSTHSQPSSSEPLSDPPSV
jgi:O-antigen ligase